MAKLLLVEDDEELAQNVQLFLVSEKHVVDRCVEGASALAMLAQYPYDLIVIDLGLPDMSGIDVCSRYRSNGGKSAVLALTGKHEQKDKISAFDAGFDDYITKPFNSKELLARMRALLRRQDFGTEKELVSPSGGLRIDTASCTCLGGAVGKEIDLDPKAFQILCALLSSPQGDSLSSRQLLYTVWGRDESALLPALRIWIHRLRRALSSAQVNDEIISIAGGYQVVRKAK